MSQPERKKNRTEARDERRARLLQAARQVFSQKGYHPATVDDITRAAGVAKGTFYLYFAEKRTIFYHLVQQFFDLVTDIGRSAAADVQTRRDYFARIEAATTRLAEVFAENRDLVRLVYRESMGLDEPLEKMVRGFYRSMAGVEADNIRLGIRLGLLRDDLDPTLAAYAHIGMAERVLLQWQFDRAFPKVPDLVNQLLDLIYSGLRVRE